MWTRTDPQRVAEARQAILEDCEAIKRILSLDGQDQDKTEMRVRDAVRRVRDLEAYLDDTIGS